MVSPVAFILESDCSMCHGDGFGMRTTGLLRDVAIQESLTNAYKCIELRLTFVVSVKGLLGADISRI